MKRSALYIAKEKCLIITLGDKKTVYTVEDLCPDPKVASPAFRLTKPDGEFHDVSVNKHGTSCTCGAFTFRNPDNTPCKHIRALRAWKLLQEASKEQ